MVSVQTLSVQPAAALRGWLLLPVLALFGGCATLGESKPVAETAPTGTACEVFTMWNPNVLFAPDPTHQGASTPAISGWVWLYSSGELGGAVVADGSMEVSLYEEHPRQNPDGTPIPLEIWRITPECLKSYVKRHPVGWGYTLNLPWGTYRPDIGRIQLQVKFQPEKGSEKGMPLYRDDLVTLQNSGGNGAIQATMQAAGTTHQGKLIQANGHPHQGGTIQTGGTAPLGGIPQGGTQPSGLTQLGGTVPQDGTAQAGDTGQQGNRMQFSPSAKTLVPAAQ